MFLRADYLNNDGTPMQWNSISDMYGVRQLHGDEMISEGV